MVLLSSDAGKIIRDVVQGYIPLRSSDIRIIDNKRKIFTDIFHGSIYQKSMPDLPYIFVKDERTRAEILETLNSGNLL